LNAFVVVDEPKVNAVVVGGSLNLKLVFELKGDENAFVPWFVLLELNAVLVVFEPNVGTDGLKEKELFVCS